ncbi:Eco29kI family restriction endonuclease [Isoptericola sediminis]|uniref:Eco29kI family restriction endonuclease n=1 Tax=Isoptericola sediminis TaxID=2733572 RepID=A0A849K4R6_9MICO|nr:Eco29kI family restriction endonuclease [Isoptericola sediminis]NNU26785.1 Eco29kI family restriction endonuclease [Isoptericola sediminis]
MTTNDPHPFNPLAIDNLAESIVTRLVLSDAVPLAKVGTFQGAGCYAIYYTGDNLPHPAYVDLAALNTPDGLLHPMYVGKAIPKGGRKGVDIKVAGTKALSSRLGQHRKSVEAATNLSIDDFYARWLVLDDVWIPLGESLLISRYRPVWNALVDGFGKNPPGKERATGIRSRWDTIHPGRAWSLGETDRKESAADIEQEIAEFLRSRLGGVPQATP